MSRSKKIEMYTDRAGWKTRLYWRRVRRSINQFIGSQWFKEDFTESSIPKPKEIENDYDYCDYKFPGRDNPYSKKVPK